MTLVEHYNEISEKVINNDRDVVLYEKKLRNKLIFVNHLIASSRIDTLLLHPIRLVRTKKEVRRLNKIEKGFYKLRYSKLEDSINWKEAGEFGEDLEKAAKEYKIGNIKDFMSNHVIDDEKINQKLLKLRNKGF